MIFPKYCCYCHKNGDYLCSVCYELIEYYSAPVDLTLPTLYLDEICVLGTYSEPLKSLIHSLKYQSVKGIAQWCAQLLWRHTHIPPADVIVPVPISHQRWRERGFNQAEEIGVELAKLIGIPCQTLLQRTKHSPPQASISNEETRKLRLTNHFTLAPTAKLDTFQTVLLLDDVLTTGSTLNECAKVLKLQGYKTVNALTLAHGF